MHRRLRPISAAILVMSFAATGASADTTIIGNTGQADKQAANSNQSATNSDSAIGPLTPAGNVFVVPSVGFVAGDSAPTSVQTSTNALNNVASIGGGSAHTTLINSDAQQCICQGSNQGANSDQEGGGTLQDLTNSVSSIARIGGGRDDLILIGGASQTNQQGANAIQTGNDDNSFQHSLNMVLSRVILGG